MCEACTLTALSKGVEYQPHQASMLAQRLLNAHVSHPAPHTQFTHHASLRCTRPSSRPQRSSHMDMQINPPALLSYAQSPRRRGALVIGPHQRSAPRPLPFPPPRRRAPFSLPGGSPEPFPTRLRARLTVIPSWATSSSPSTRTILRERVRILPSILHRLASRNTFADRSHRRDVSGRESSAEATAASMVSFLPCITQSRPTISAAVPSRNTSLQ
mmetsp:Transcript_49698/g.111729  ORF Transcript_49698/g.111729 Transcript_49698/m.111729 type:complete len:215 (+) Transcript_49698:285-929(+)